MISVIAVAVSVVIAFAMTLASPNRFFDNLKKNPILVTVICLDVLFIGVNLLLEAISLQIIPTVKCIIAMILTVFTVFPALFGMTRRKAAIILTSFFALVFVAFGTISLPKYHGVKDFEGEEYVGLSMFLDGLEDWKCIYYYKNEAPLLISKDLSVVEDYGIVFTSDWDKIKENDPYQLEYYKNGKCVETEYYMFYDPE